MTNIGGITPNIPGHGVNKIDFEDQINKKILSLHEQVNTLFDRAKFGSITTSEDGICTGINQTCLGWLGVEKDEVLGKIAFRNWVTPESWLNIQDQKKDLESNKFTEIFSKSSLVLKFSAVLIISDSKFSLILSSNQFCKKSAT